MEFGRSVVFRGVSVRVFRNTAPGDRNVLFLNEGQQVHRSHTWSAIPTTIPISPTSSTCRNIARPAGTARFPRRRYSDVRFTTGCSSVRSRCTLSGAPSSGWATRYHAGSGWASGATARATRAGRGPVTRRTRVRLLRRADQHPGPGADPSRGLGCAGPPPFLLHHRCSHPPGGVGRGRTGYASSTIRARCDGAQRRRQSGELVAAEAAELGLAISRLLYAVRRRCSVSNPQRHARGTDHVPSTGRAIGVTVAGAISTAPQPRYVQLTTVEVASLSVIHSLDPSFLPNACS